MRVFFLLLLLLSLSAGAQPKSCPGVPGHPVDVHVGLFILDFNYIRSSDQSYSINGYLSYFWTDKRLKAGRYRRDEVWVLLLDVSNASDFNHVADGPVEVDAEGTVRTWIRFKAVLNSAFEIEDFPFDDVELIFDVQAMDEPYEVMRLISDGPLSGFATSSFDSEWEVNQRGMEGRDYATPAMQAPPHARYAEANFKFPAARRSEYYLWVYFVPLFLVVLTSWTVLWTMPPNIQVTTTALLGAITHRLAMQAVLPRLRLLTYADGFFLLSLFYIVASNIAVSLMLRLDEKKSPRRDFWRRVFSLGFPLSYLLAQGVLWKVFFP